MAGPITWRNVGSTVSNSGAGSLLAGAQQSFDGGFNALQKVLDKQQATNNENFTTGQQNTAADYLDRVAQAQSMDEIAALRNDPELASLREGLTGQFKGQVRGAVDNRETDLIAQIGARQGFSDEQINRDLRPKVQAAMAKLYNGDESGMADLQNLGLADDGETLATGFGALDKGTRLDIAQDTNSRAWSADARANEDQAFKNYERARTKQGHKLSDTQDALAREAYVGAQSLPDGMSMTEYKRATQDALVDAGVQPSEAAIIAAGVDGSVANRELASAMDTQEFQQVTSSLDKAYKISSNEFNAPVPADPQAAANEILDKFKDEDGRIAGSSDPEERQEFAEESGELMRRGVVVDGVTYRVTPAILEAAMTGTGEVFWDNRPVDAVHDYIKNSPGVQERFKEYQAWQAETNDLTAGFSESIGSGYQNDYLKQADTAIQARLRAANDSPMTRSPESARVQSTTDRINDRIPFR